MLVVVTGGSTGEGDSTATGGSIVVAPPCSDVVMDTSMDSVVISVSMAVEMPTVVLVVLPSPPTVLVSDVKVSWAKPSLVVDPGPTFTLGTAVLFVILFLGTAVHLLPCRLVMKAPPERFAMLPGDYQFIPLLPSWRLKVSVMAVV